MKRVLILYSSSSTVCGIGTWVEAVSGSLGPYGWDTKVGLAWGRRFHNPAKVEDFRPSLCTIHMDGRTGTEEGRIQAIARTIQAVRPDVIILTVLNSAFEAVRRLRYSGATVRLLAVNHGNLPEQAASLQLNADVIDGVVCVSRLSYTAMSSIAGGFPQARLLLIPNAVKTATSKPRTGFQPLVVGYVGRLSHEKRATDIAPFFRQMHQLVPDACLWVAGAGDCASAMEDLASEFPAHVLYFGELNAQTLRTKFFPRIDVIAHFSAAEAWGYSIAEGMSHGAVPVCSNYLGRSIDGLAVDHLNSLVFPVGDLIKAAQHVKKLADDPNLLGRLSSAAKANIDQNFSMNNFGRQWAQALDYCMELQPLPRPSRPSSLNLRGPLGLPRRSWEPIRRALGRQIDHASPGEEWPHFRCDDVGLTAEFSALLAANR